MKPITKDNFHLKTKANFEFVKYGNQAEELFKELVKENGLFFRSASLSKYVIVGNEVYRFADHWGNVASCSWYLKNAPKMPTWTKNWVLAKCKLSDFVSMMKPIEVMEFEGKNLNTGRSGKWTIPFNKWSEEIKSIFEITTEPKLITYYE